MSQTLYFGVFKANSLFLIDSLDLTKTLFELEFDLVCLFYFELFLVPLVVRLTFPTLSLLSCKRFVKGFPLLALVRSIL
jgi:hypothetical protein